MPAIDAESTAQNMQDAVIQKFMDLGKDEPAAIVEAPPAPAPAPSAPPPPPPSTPKPVVAPPADSAPPASAEPFLDKPPEGLSAAASANWKKFKETTQAVIDKKSKELDDVKKQLEDARKASAAAPAAKPLVDFGEYESLKKKAAELESSLERLDLANSPKFRNYYDGGIEKQIKIARSAAGHEHADEVTKLLHQPRSAERNARLKELVEELGIEGGVIANALASITQLKLEREEQLANHTENLKLLRQQERLESEHAEQSKSASRKAKADAIVERLTSLPEFKPSDTDTEHKAFAESALEFIRAGVNGKLAEDDALLLPAAAMKAQYLEKIAMPRLLKENKELKARLEEIAAARPRMGGSAAAENAKSKEEVSTDDPWGIAAVTKKFVQAGQG